MKFYTFQIVIERNENGKGYHAYSPSLPGCFGAGRTIEKARWSMHQGIQQHIASLIEHGDPVPQDDKIVHVEGVTVGIP